VQLLVGVFPHLSAKLPQKRNHLLCPCLDLDSLSYLEFAATAAPQCLLRLPITPNVQPMQSCSNRAWHRSSCWLMGTVLISGIISVSGFASHASTHFTKSSCTLLPSVDLILCFIVGSSSYHLLWALACLHVRTYSCVSKGLLHLGQQCAFLAVGEILDFCCPVLSQP